MTICSFNIWDEDDDIWVVWNTPTIIWWHEPPEQNERLQYEIWLRIGEIEKGKMSPWKPPYCPPSAEKPKTPTIH